MRSKARVYLEVSLPQDLLRSFLQSVRDFDVTHDRVPEFSIIVRVPEMTTDETLSLLDSIEPGFRYRVGIKLP